MKTAVKAGLLSALVFPGAGQLLQKKRKRGIALILITAVSFVIVVVKAVQQALTILETIASEGGVIDMDRISETAAGTITSSENFIIPMFLSLLILCWIIGVVDALFLGGEENDLGQPD
jgi:hypothetical protein